MIRGFVLGLQFLSRLPMNIPIEFNKENLRKSTFFYPVIGMILGGLASIPYYFLSKYNIRLASFFTVLMIIILTGGLHLDGLSDSADGFFANKNKGESLAIMKDSRIGAFGVLSLILLILFKYILISSFEKNLPLALVFSMGNSRMVTLFHIAFKKIARPGGLGDTLHTSKPKTYVLLGSGLYIGLLAIINLKYLIPLLGSFIMGEIISSYSYRKIGGLTGDVYGAIIELTEVAALLIFWGLMV